MRKKFLQENDSCLPVSRHLGYRAVFIGCHVDKGSILSLTRSCRVAMPPAVKKEEKEKTIKGKEGTLQRRDATRRRQTQDGSEIRVWLTAEDRVIGYLREVCGYVRLSRHSDSLRFR